MATGLQKDDLFFIEEMALPPHISHPNALEDSARLGVKSLQYTFRGDIRAAASSRLVRSCRSYQGYRRPCSKFRFKQPVDPESNV